MFKIDIHTHIIPKEWIDLKNKGVIDIEIRENVSPPSSSNGGETNQHISQFSRSY